MSEKYYNSDGKVVSKEEFDKERQEILDESFEMMKDPNNMIPFEDWDYYLDELEKLRDKN